MAIKAEATLSAMIESSVDPIWSVDREYRLLAFNSALRQNCARKFGSDPQIGMRPQDFPPQGRGEIWPPLYDRALREGPFHKEFTLSDGRTLEFSFNPILVDGKAEGVSIFGKDITERKRAEEALLAAETKYRNLFENAVEGMFATSLIDQTRSVNPAYAQMLGYDSPEEVIAILQHDPECEWAEPGQREIFATRLREEGAVHGFECQLRCKDGGFIWVSVSCRLIYDENGVAISRQGFVKNITERKRAELHLRESEKRFRSTFEQAAVGIMHVSFEGEILTCNPRLAEIVGYGVDELVGMNLQQITPKDFLPRCEEYLHRLNQGEPNFPAWEKPYLRKDGGLAWVRITASMQRDAEGRPLHHIAFVEDINAQKGAEMALATAARALKTSETRFRTVFQMMMDALVISRAEDGVFLEVNEAFLRFSGFERDEVIGKTGRELDLWENDNDRRMMDKALERTGNCRDLEVRFKRKNGEFFWGLLSASLIDLDGVPSILCVTRDISSVKAAEDTIRDLAFYDSLTRLPNRRLLLDRLQQSLTASTRSPRKLALLFVDLDNFKLLNDTLGHQTGDLLLKEVAIRLPSCVRESDTVAHLGGDKFGVMLEGLSGTPEDAAAQAKAVAEKIFDCLERSFSIDAREVHSRCSVGITVFGLPHQNPNAILQQAEIAMYQAKDAGRGSIRFFSPELQAAVNARAALEEDLRQAIRKEEFALYFQPQVDETGLIGAEVLIRWNHPERGLLLPGEFIPLAEETGLILGLGSWTLEAACAQVAEWEKHYDKPRFAVAVNISAREFRQADFVERVLASVARTGANPMTLKLELTESMLVDNLDDIIAKMTELREHGLSFSLDDFGTGYSSLSYLKRLPLDQLKIDRAFVRDILSDVSSGAIAQTIISLSKAMGLSVIAEGVETEGQRDFLMQLGCSSFQGYLYGRPLPAAEFERLWLSSMFSTTHITC
jgi:diguanylate cyclase (GGDEF)-like protein/PAS domain S-box-containing protein